MRVSQTLAVRTSIVMFKLKQRRHVERTACQMVYLRGVPDTGGGEQAAEGAFVISPSERFLTLRVFLTFL